MASVEQFQDTEAHHFRQGHGITPKIRHPRPKILTDKGEFKTVTGFLRRKMVAEQEPDFSLMGFSSKDDFMYDAKMGSKASLRGEDTSTEIASPISLPDDTNIPPEDRDTFGEEDYAEYIASPAEVMACYKARIVAIRAEVQAYPREHVPYDPVWEADRDQSHEAYLRYELSERRANAWRPAPRLQPIKTLFRRLRKRWNKEPVSEIPQKQTTPTVQSEVELSDQPNEKGPISLNLGHIEYSSDPVQKAWEAQKMTLFKHTVAEDRRKQDIRSRTTRTTPHQQRTPVEDADPIEAKLKRLDTREKLQGTTIGRVSSFGKALEMATKDRRTPDVSINETNRD